MLFDPAPRRGPATASERWMAGAFLLVVVGLFAGEVCSDYSPAKLGALFILLLWLPLLALHEGGHALAATVLGWRVERIVIGMGRPMASFRVGTARVEVRLLPLEGFVASRPLDLNNPRLESAVIYFAGPGIELLLALAVLATVGPDDLFTLSDDYSLILFQCLAATATWQAVQNLIPFGMQVDGRALCSDGLGIILSFVRPMSYFKRMVGRSYPAERNEDEWEEAADEWKNGPRE